MSAEYDRPSSAQTAGNTLFLFLFFSALWISLKIHYSVKLWTCSFHKPASVGVCDMSALLPPQTAAGITHNPTEGKLEETHNSQWWSNKRQRKVGSQRAENFNPLVQVWISEITEDKFSLGQVPGAAAAAALPAPRSGCSQLTHGSICCCHWPRCLYIPLLTQNCPVCCIVDQLGHADRCCLFFQNYIFVVEYTYSWQKKKFSTPLFPAQIHHYFWRVATIPDTYNLYIK